jgi:hypothetical protein
LGSYELFLAILHLGGEILDRVAEDLFGLGEQFAHQLLAFCIGLGL